MQKVQESNGNSTVFNASDSSSPFLWGAATSAHQVEGGNHHNDWWAWEEKGRVEGGARSGLATDHWRRFREDLQRAKDLGLNSYRFSLEWSRIEPTEGEFQKEALEQYASIIAECERLSLIPMVTLHHFTSPKWFAEDGGFVNSRSVERFERFVNKVVSVLGARVRWWCTINEPMVLLAGTYLGKIMPPGIYAPEKVGIAFYHLLRAHVAAYETIHRLVESPQVGMAHNLLYFLPDRQWHPVEQLLTRLLHQFYNRAWLDAVMGKKARWFLPFLVPPPPAWRLPAPRTDFIGINYYTKAYVHFRPRGGAHEQHSEVPVGLSFSRRKESASDLGWAVFPEGMKRLLEWVATYQKPILITENGIADRDDSLRENYLRSHLVVLAELIQKGVDIRGYFHWSLLDNFEWIKGFWPRFGLFEVNYENFERVLRPSARAYQSIIRLHQTQEGALAPRKEWIVPEENLSSLLMGTKKPA